MTCAWNCCEPFPCVGPHITPAEVLAANLAGLATSAVGGSIGIARGLIEGLMWGGHRPHFAACSCAHAGTFGHHCYIVECYPRLPQPVCCCSPCCC